MLNEDNFLECRGTPDDEEENGYINNIIKVGQKYNNNRRRF